MDNINGINGAAGNLSANKIRQAYHFVGVPPRGTDSVQLSNDVMTVRGVDQVRTDRIMEIRKQLKDGTYVTPERLDKALDKALDDVLSRL